MNKKIKVLIVEDDPIILKGYKEMLIDSGFDVVGEAYDGKTAVEKVIDIKPDLVIMDINLPVMDGLTATEKINNIYSVPCVIITGYKKKEYLNNANRIGIFGYLQKPIDEDNIRNTISIAMSRFKEFNEQKKKTAEIMEALETRKLVERAKGILMDKLDFKESQAMKYLQKKSRDKNKKLAEIANEIIKADKIIDL